ncbi:hypothetical protein FLAN108750_13815 [Flavobacterium antarcticum]|uniref:hypothetical protein n=1 Tax=Flavobacterium antarcticum TaxID=271155 RepID=UPI0003B551AF|nr:hypothetical protein [Flavobacterium antarcticum]
MQKFLVLLVLLSFQCGFSQTPFEKMPENAKEIHFTYKQKLKVHIDESGVYADSLFFKTYFPQIHSTKVIHPKAYYLNTKVELKAFKNEDKRQLAGILYHNNESYVGIHFMEQNKSVIWAERNDEAVKAIFKKYFKQSYSKFKYKIEIYYDKQVKHVLYPSAYYQFGFAEIQKQINWISKTEGVYSEVIKDKRYSYALTFDENLSKYVSMGYIFKNSDFGVSKIESFESILQLIEVKYK